MSFHINSDKEKIRGVNPKLIGDNELTIRGGTGSSEKEILRTQLDSETDLPRVGINRTGQRVNTITITESGSGYTAAPLVELTAPPEGGTQALASAFIFNGRVINIAVNNPVIGYSTAPQVVISGGNGSGAAATSALDTVDFELDINGAIRTSTSIISDTARILNLDIDNFITPDTNFRAPNLKTYQNNTGTLWAPNIILQENSFRYFGSNVYQALNAGETGPSGPEHVDGIVANGEVNFKHVGFRVINEEEFRYNDTGDAGVYPRSITPLLGDRSDKIATTEYVLNLATNDVGGRVYVSEQIGSDLNDGRSAVAPVRTIKKAAQIAWSTPGVKETLIVSGGDYVEDNPISLPPDASVVGDNLRLVIIRPNNPGKHIFKFGDKNYVTGVTYRDKIDANGDAVATWDYAMVFDDKQRILVDKEVNGDIGVKFPIGHQVFGPDQFRVDFTGNTGLSTLANGLDVVGLNTGSRANIIDVRFEETTGASAYISGSADVELKSGSFVQGEQFSYITSAGTGAAISGLTITAASGENKLRSTSDPSSIIPAGTYVFVDDTNDAVFTQGYYQIASITPDDIDTPTYWDIRFFGILGAPEWNSTAAISVNINQATPQIETFNSTSLISIRAEGEVVSVNEDFEASYPIIRLDFSKQGDPSITQNGFQFETFGNSEDIGGVVFYTSELVGRSNTHELKEGEEIVISGMPTSNPDLSALNGKQRIYKVLEDADGRARRFVIPKKFPAIVDNNIQPGQTAVAKTFTRSVTLSLLNSPNTFATATPVERRYQDAVTFIRNNREFIADEVVGKINDQFKRDYYSVYDIGGQATAQFTPTNVTYNPATGDTVFTVNNHGLSVGNGIRIADQSITFTCAMDGNQTEHALPDTDQFASGRSLPITASDTNTFTVNVGASGPDQQFTPSGANYDPATGSLVLTVGPHTLSVGEGIIIDDNSLSFTCDMDGNQSVKTYPRPGIDPFAGRSMPITAVAENTITINAGISGPNKYFTPTGANYNPVTGDMTVTVGQHGLGVGRSVVLADNSFTFTCALDGNVLQSTYPRPGQDPFAGKSIAISAVGSTQHTATDAPYDAATGVVTLTVSNHGFANGDYVLIDAGSLTYTCDLDGNTVQKSYPRYNYDYPSGRWLEISNVTTNTFDINVGSSSYTGTHTFVSAGVNGIDHQDGTFTINVGTSSDTSAHTFISASANAIKHEPQSIHSFSGSASNAVKHLPQSVHTFVRSESNSLSVGGSSFSIYLGTLDHVNTWVSGGTVTSSTGAVANVTNFVYDTSNTGVAVVTTDQPLTLANDDIVRLADLLIECEAGQKIYPAYSAPTSTNSGSNGDVQCKQDVIHFLNALTRDLEFGSNHNIIEAADRYVVGAKIAYIENEIIQTVRAIEYARELAIFAMCNWRTGDRTQSSPIYVPEFTSSERYFDDTVITATAGSPACDDVRSAIDTLAYLYVDVIGNDASGTYLDAAYLIARNRDLIAEQALTNTETNFPTLGLSDLHQRKCRRDINYILGGLVRDLVLGGNAGIVSNAETYFSGSVLVGVDASQLPSTRYAYTQVAELAKKAMRNWSDGTIIQSTPTTATYNASTGEVTVSISGSVGNPTTNDRIAFKQGALTFNCAFNSGGDHASPSPTDKNRGKSHAITNVSTGGGLTTITCNVGSSSYTGAHSFVSALTDGTILIFDPVVPSVNIPTFEDWDILPYSSNPLCANVSSTIDTEMQLLDDILGGVVLPGATTQTYGTLFNTAEIRTYPDSFIYDQNNNRMAVSADYDDYPIIEASPYTQNASVISFLGGGGAEVDGNKVKQPNSPFPGLNLDGSATFPNQGKSMVAAAFTIVSFGGTGYRVVNDGYTQLVSVFVIFCSDGVIAESGGYCSITNSATNFGQYALRAIGFRKDAYEFDIATVSNVSATPTGRTILTVAGLGREPLEHYIVKIDGYKNSNPDIEYFIDSIAAVTVDGSGGQLTIDDGTGQAMSLIDISNNQAVSNSVLTGKTIRLHRPSIVNSSSHTWEYAGSGTNYNALPENGGTKDESSEQVSQNYGRVYVSGTDELGDFKVGTFAKIENRTGNITFTGTVTISEVEFLKLKGGDVVVTGFDASNTLGGASASDSKIPTQKAVKDFITNNLGPYINKPYSTNAVPRALVELTDSGKISIDQIPALRPFSVYTVPDVAGRTSIEGALAGDIAIQQDTSTSFILNEDNDTLFLGFNPDPALSFTIGDVFTGSVSNGRLQSTEYREGVIYRINITNSGSGYVTAPNIVISGGNPSAGAIAAEADCTIANGEVVTVTITLFNGLLGGKGYTTQPTITFDAPPGGGIQAQGSALLESRLYGDIVNRIKIEDTDTIQDSTSPSTNTVNLTRTVNTSSFDIANWVSLSSEAVSVNTLVSSGPNELISTSLLGANAANSFTFLRGDQSYALTVQSLKGAENRYFASLYSQASVGTNSLIFTTNSNTLIGHEVVDNILGIPANTNITGVITTGGLTTVAIDNPITDIIPAGTIIEFLRGESPITFESTYTQGQFVESIIIAAPGSGFSNGQFFDVPLFGGSGTGLAANITVVNNEVTSVVVTDGGVNFNADFSITVPPTEIGSGSGLVLDCKVSTINRQYANISLDIARVSDLTISADLYGTIGVSRYKKSQFNIGQGGNGSVELKTGPDSGLDADLLDGAQGAYYLNAGNLNAGTLLSDRLAGNYNIDISGQSQNTIRVISGTNNPVSSPAPNTFVTGIVSNTIFNSAAALNDGGSKTQIVTFRPGGQGFTVDGGVKQLAFTDNDNMYLRGSGSGVSTFGTWAKVWTSGNDGVGTGLDADRLDNKQGSWYQNALNINSGTISDNRLPTYKSASSFRDQIEIKSYSGDPRYRIYVSGQTLTDAKYSPGADAVNLYNSNDQATGVIEIDDRIINDDVGDNFNDYTILIGRLTTGNFVGAIKIGDANESVFFQDFSIEDGNNFVAATLESNSGNAQLKLGRSDGISSAPAVLFNSSTLTASYNSKIEASGGNATDGSGQLNIVVGDENSLSINSQTVWNAGNTAFNSSNIVSTAALTSAVARDTNGDFSAGTITAALTGAASLNVLKAGDTMTGPLTLTGANSDLSISGTSLFTGVVSMSDDLNVDSGTLFVDAGSNEVGINAGTNPLSTLDVRGDGGIFVRSITNAVGAKIRFCDVSSNQSQVGTLRYNHSDSQSPASEYGEGFTMEGTETELYFRVVGDVIASRKMGVGINREPDYTLEVNGNAMFQTGVTIDTDNDNSGAPLVFRGSSSYRNFRIGNQLVGNHLFTIQASTNNGGTTWNGTPAITVAGDSNRVGINTTATSGTDPESGTNRNYQLNIQGDVNFNGQLFQNNAEFVTSRWTEASNGNDIYRLSKVGINVADPTYTLQVSGTFKATGNSEIDGTFRIGTAATNRIDVSGSSMNIQSGTFSSGQISNGLKINGDKQYIDKYGIIKRNRSTITDNITITASDRCMSAGPIEIASGNTVTIVNGGAWSVV